MATAMIDALYDDLFGGDEFVSSDWSDTESTDNNSSATGMQVVPDSVPVVLPVVHAPAEQLVHALEMQDNNVPEAEVPQFHNTDSMPPLNTVWYQPRNNQDCVDFINMFVTSDKRPEGTGLDAGGVDQLLQDPPLNDHLLQDLFYVSSRMLSPADKRDLLYWSPDLFSEEARFRKEHWNWWLEYVYPKCRAMPLENEWCTYALVGMIRAYLPHYQWTGNMLLMQFDPVTTLAHRRSITETCPGPVTRFRAKQATRLRRDSSMVLLDRFVRVLKFDDEDLFWMYDNRTYDFVMY